MPPSGERRFVVQRHRARRLHYDLRLEAAGVLLSWAVPKGPTLDPDVKRLAVHVEDHPLDYFDFEGVIPGGEYGGGDVIVWDWGTWSLDEDAEAAAAAALEAGPTLHFDLDGEKLHGRFVLIRRGRGVTRTLAPAPQARRAGGEGLGSPRTTRFGEERAHQRRGKAAPVGDVVERRLLGRGRRPTSSTRSTPLGEAARGTREPS